MEREQRSEHPMLTQPHDPLLIPIDTNHLTPTPCTTVPSPPPAGPYATRRQHPPDLLRRSWPTLSSAGAALHHLSRLSRLQLRPSPAPPRLLDAVFVKGGSLLSFLPAAATDALGPPPCSRTTCYSRPGVVPGCNPHSTQALDLDSLIYPWHQQPGASNLAGSRSHVFSFHGDLLLFFSDLIFFFTASGGVHCFLPIWSLLLFRSFFTSPFDASATVQFVDMDLFTAASAGISYFMVCRLLLCVRSLIDHAHERLPWAGQASGAPPYHDAMRADFSASWSSAIVVASGKTVGCLYPKSPNHGGHGRYGHLLHCAPPRRHQLPNAEKI